MTSPFFPLVLASYAYFVFRRLLQYLHIFQQEEYKSGPFFKWIIETRSFDKKLSLGILAAFLARPLFPSLETDLVLSFLFILTSLFENDPRKVAKKKLVMTKRAFRIFALALAFAFVLGLALSKTGSVLAWVVAVQAIPAAIAAATLALSPLETHIQNKIMAEAKAVLARIDPQVIGITGSFGKTSIKHILGHVLGLNAPTLFTPGSVNTLMGVSRGIRENLLPGIRYFLVEMGAYGRGSIEKLCRLTPPKIGVVTALGMAHYERFKTLDTVARAKFELAEAVLANPDGKMIVHESVLQQDYARAFVRDNRSRFLVCGHGDDADLVVKNAEQTATGLTVGVTWQGESFSLFAPLFGAVHADNLALAFLAAIACGVPPERAAAALRTVPQISHRLEVRRQKGAPVYIDDAYNSNPRGFEAALDFLELIGKDTGGRKILVTPGILELGDKHEDVHRALGEKAAAKADILFVVRPDRIPGFAESFSAKAPDKEIHRAGSFRDAREWLIANTGPGDVVLLENDLPDVNEARLSL
ncbi:MAG: UDP-N-acetylmuramoyl-tripeptide--D-alanyl-D-alanine ligase [Alphaproteobacteria bacterium]|nr:UDP-N-acetylmuramoyl-tripeptide--D-alanyl-D-alanine ligase [Alphaproteobacteria bacterium]